MIKKSLLVLAVIVALTAGVFAAPEKSAKPQTVGEFAVKVNAALGKVTADQKAAADSLKALGVDLGKDLSAALTEERAAGILRDLGVRVVPTSSNSELSAAKADQLINAVSLSASAAISPAQDPVFPPGCSAQGQNRGECVECCKAANGCVNQEEKCDFAAGCSRLCRAAILPPGKSPFEPQ